MRLITTAATLGLTASLASAAFVDDFDTTANIDPRDALSDVALSNSVATITFTAAANPGDAANSESVIDYFVGAEASAFNANQPGATTFSLATESVFETTGLTFINPDGEDDVRLIIRAFYYDANDAFVGPAAILRPASLLQDETDLAVDVATVALSGAVGYTLGISLIKPSNQTGEVGDGVSFDQIGFTAIPEPSSLAAVGLLGLVGLRRRR